MLLESFVSRKGDIIGFKRSPSKNTADLDRKLSDAFDALGGPNSIGCQILDEFIENAASKIPEVQTCDAFNRYLDTSLRKTVRQEAAAYRAFLAAINPSFRMPGNVEFMLDRFADAFVDFVKTAVYYPLCTTSKTATINRHQMVARLRRLKSSYCTRPQAPTSTRPSTKKPTGPPSTTRPVTKKPGPPTSTHPTKKPTGRPSTRRPIFTQRPTVGQDATTPPWLRDPTRGPTHAPIVGGGAVGQGEVSDSDNTTVHIENSLDNDGSDYGGFGFGVGYGGVVPVPAGVGLVQGVSPITGEVVSGYVDPLTGVFVPVTEPPVATEAPMTTTAPLPGHDAHMGMPSLQAQPNVEPLLGVEDMDEDEGMRIFGMPILMFCLVLFLVIAAGAIAYWKWGDKLGNGPKNMNDMGLNIPPPPPPADFEGPSPRF